MTTNKKVPKVAMKAAKIEVNISRESKQKITESAASSKGRHTRVIHAVQP